MNNFKIGDKVRCFGYPKLSDIWYEGGIIRQVVELDKFLVSVLLTRTEDFYVFETFYYKQCELVEVAKPKKKLTMYRHWYLCPNKYLEKTETPMEWAEYLIVTKSAYRLVETEIIKEFEIEE